MPIQAPTINGMGGGNANTLAAGQAAQMAAAKRDSDTASGLTAVNQVGATALSFIPYVGPLLSALASGIGAIANSKAQADAKKKMEMAQQGPAVPGNSATGIIQGQQIGQAAGQQQGGGGNNDINTFLSGLGQQRMG